MLRRWVGVGFLIAGHGRAGRNVLAAAKLAFVDAAVGHNVGANVALAAKLRVNLEVHV